MASTSPTMLALVFDAPASDTSASRVAEIGIPDPGEISIDVHHAGINFKDVMERRGDPGYVARWPFVPGLEVAGTVRMVGAGVDHLRIGDRVAAFTGAGGLAEVAVTPAELVVRVPGVVDLALAAAAPGVLVTAWLLLDEVGRLRSGEVLLVHGAAGGVGQAVARLGRRLGAGLLLGTVGGEGRVAAAERVGYDRVLVRGPTLAADIREVTGGRGFDVVLDPQGTTLLDVDLEAAAPGGRIVLFGNAPGTPLGQLPPPGRLLGGNLSIAGFSISSLAAAAPERVGAGLRRVLDLVAAGGLSLELTAVTGLAAAPEAQQALAEGRGLGKYVVAVRSDPAG